MYRINGPKSTLQSLKRPEFLFRVGILISNGFLAFIFKSAWFIVPILLSVWEILYIELKNSKENIEPESLKSCLEMLHSQLLTIANKKSKRRVFHDLRVCLFAIDDDGNLIQVINYITEPETIANNYIGRLIEPDKGIIGRALNAEDSIVNEPCWAMLSENVKTHSDFIEEMVNFYNYTRKEAADLNKFRKSWCAVAIGSSGKKLHYCT